MIKKLSVFEKKAEQLKNILLERDEKTGKYKLKIPFLMPEQANKLVNLFDAAKIDYDPVDGTISEK